MKSAEERKQQSIALLKEQGVPYIEHLPVNWTICFSTSRLSALTVFTKRLA